MHPLAHAVYTVVSGLTFNAALASLLADHPAVKEDLHKPIYGEPGGVKGIKIAARVLEKQRLPGEVYAGFLAHLAQDTWWEENVRLHLSHLSLNARRSVETCWSIRHLKSSEERRRISEMILSISTARQAELDELLYVVTGRRTSTGSYLGMCAEHYSRDYDYSSPECTVIEESFDSYSLVSFVNEQLAELGAL